MTSFKLFGSKNKTKTVNYLSLTPIALISHEINQDNTISLLIPRFRSKFWGRYLMSGTNKKFMRLNLDEYGSETWKLINGQWSVQEICEQLTQKFGNDIQPVEIRVTQFLTGLYRNEFLTFAELSGNPASSSL